MKKYKKIEKNLRRLLIALISIVLIVIFALLFKQVKYPGVKEENNIFYNYNNISNINYQVHLKPNILYDEDILDEDNIYITEFVDNIYTTFEYEFNGDKSAEILGSYEIIAQMEGYIGEEKEGNIKTIWKKDFIIEPTTEFQTTDKKINIKKNVYLNINEYNQFARKVIELSEIGIPIKLSVFMNVKLQADTDKGKADVHMTPSITIPINTNYFEIKKIIHNDSGTIEDTKQMPMPVNKVIVLIYTCLLMLLLGTLTYIIQFTENKKQCPLEKHLKKIFKKYGDRLVALNQEIMISDPCSEVKSIDDLVKIADEIGKPIMYRHSQNYDEITKFYVIDEKQIYAFNINAMTYSHSSTV